MAKRKSEEKRLDKTTGIVMPTALKERINQYAEDFDCDDESFSWIVRFLIKKGLEAEYAKKSNK